MAFSVNTICMAGCAILLGTVSVLALGGDSAAPASQLLAAPTSTRLQPAAVAAWPAPAVPGSASVQASLVSSTGSSAEEHLEPFAEQQATVFQPMAFLAVASVACAAVVYFWRRATRSAGLLQPAYMEFGQPTVAMYYTSGTHTGRRSTEVYNLFDRVSRLVRSNVTSLVQSLEDPEKIIEQAVNDMQVDLIKIRQSYSEVLATQKRTEVKQRQALEAVEQWQKRAELALTKGDEELAREALRRKNIEQKALDGINTQLAQAGPIAENLLNSMKLLEAKLDEAKANKAQLIARAKSAETSKRVNDMLTGLDTGSAMAAFERMEEKVQGLEAASEVSGLLAEGSTMDKRFKALEGSSAVEDELAAMKRQLTGETSKPAAYLPPAADEDDEIERIRRQLQSK
eukprot:EG_transcript_13115